MDVQLKEPQELLRQPCGDGIAHGAGGGEDTVVIQGHHVVVVGGQLELEAVGVDLVVQLHLQHRKGPLTPLGGLPQEGEKHGDVGKPRHLHSPPVAAAAAEIAQTVAVITDGADEGGDDVIRHVGRVDEGVEGVMPVEGHADARLNGAPAQSVVEGRFRGTGRLAAPAHHQLRKALGIPLVPRLAVAVAQAPPFVVAGELPRPLGVLIGGGVALPVHRGGVGELVGVAAGAKLTRQDLLGGLDLAVGRIAPHVLPIVVGDGEVVVHAQGGADVVGQLFFGGLHTLLAEGHVDIRKGGDGTVKGMTEQGLVGGQHIHGGASFFNSEFGIRNCAEMAVLTVIRSPRF